jgi:hypothetical protein
LGALAALVVLALSLCTVVVSAGPAHAAEICAQYGSTTVQGRYIIQNNRWGASTTQCINTTNTGFSITQADHNVPTNGAPASYPSIYYGCHYANCSPGTVLPLQLSNSAVDRIATSVDYTFVSNATYNAAYDIWLDPTPRVDGQNTGAEVMIWANRQGSIQPIGSPVGTVQLDGATWEVWFGNTGWNVVSYLRTSPTTSLDFPVSTFLDDAVSRGYAQRSWYLTSIQAGFEPWIGGAGLAVNDFSVTTDANPAPDPDTDTDPDPGPDPDPEPGDGGCAATYEVGNSWQGGFQTHVTVRNTGAVPISGWTVSWVYGGGQTVSQLWNGTLRSGGPDVTVDNASWNGGLGAGASTSFGFIGSGTGGAPTLTCTTG